MLDRDFVFEVNFVGLEIVDWGETPSFDMVINATSIGLKNEDEIKLDYTGQGTGKFFYDVIYNPKKTNFLTEAERRGNQIENGKMMFVYQAQQAFEMWTGLLPPATNKKVLQLLEND